jgi:hypothetical protein
MRFVLLALVATASCSLPDLLPNKLSHQTCAARTVSGSQILCDGSAVAEVRCDGRVLVGCKALFIAYPGGERTVLYQAANFDIDKPDKYYAHNKADYFEGALYPSLAPDGSKVWFKRTSFGSSTWREYDIARGEIRDIGEDRLWEKIHFEYRDKDIAIAAQ